MHNSINSSSIHTRNIFIIIKSRMSKESEGQKIEILKVMKSEIPVTEGLPLLFYVKIKEGSEPIYLKYTIMKEKHPMELISFFESRSNIKVNKEEPDHISETSANQDSDHEADFSEDEESQQEEEVEESRNKPIPGIRASMPSKKVKVDEPAKTKQEVKQAKKRVKFQDDDSEDEDEEEREEEPQSVSPENVNFHSKLVDKPADKPKDKPEPPGPKTMEMVDYDQILKDIDMVDSISPAVLSSRLIDKIPVRNYTIDRGDPKESSNKSKNPPSNSSRSKSKGQKHPNKQPAAKKSNRK